ncbi:HNH endonuclease [Pseudomonas saponiphila]|uniref:HNH endonuclease n=1 Tax=Pseudomonas saponiphila TaxID=556534 RepID=UPI00224066A8|nr:HNH endonuclease signature motif containing protein [Pseudomonas saponiphila]
MLLLMFQLLKRSSEHMVNFAPPVPGSNLNNDDLTQLFQCSPQGGMRRSNRTNTLVIVSNHVASIYDDRWVNDVLHYTGMGQQGDQSLEFNQNRTLNESRANSVSVHLFEVFTAKTYTYIGEVMLADEPYRERQPDAEGQERFVWVFPLRLKSGALPAIPDSTLQQLNQVKEKQARKLSDAEVEALARRQGRTSVGKRSAKVTQHQRSAWVAEHAKRRSKGRCDLCQEAAPFNKKDGSPFLETHHIVWLVKGGADTVENTAALCPNCHRRMHVLDDDADRQLLTVRLSGL